MVASASSASLHAESPRAYRAAYNAILDDIHTGVIRAGSKLPSERVLVQRLGLSRVTIRQALGKLADDGYLTASAQRGWFLRDTKIVGEPPSQLQSFTEMARDRGFVPSSRTLESKVRPATFAEAEALSIVASSPVLELRRLRFLDDVPVCTDAQILVVARAPGIADVDLTDKSLYGVLEDECGVRIVRSDYEVHAEIVDPEDAELLRLETGQPVLIGTEIAYDTDGHPVLSGRMTYRGDAYRFRATLFRPAE